MNLIDTKFSEYLDKMDDQVVANFIREIVFSLPEEQRREAIIKHLPEINTVQHDEPQPRVWTVEVCRTATAFKVITVIATTEEEACEKAIDEAGNEEFGSGEAEYSTPDGAY